MSEYIDELYEAALILDIKPDDFWNYTIRENEDLIKAKSDRMINQRKQEVSDAYNQAMLIGKLYHKLWDKNNGIKIEELWELYPELFKEEKEAAEIKETKQAAAARHNFADRYNKRFEKQTEAT